MSFSIGQFPSSAALAVLKTNPPARSQTSSQNSTGLQNIQQDIIFASQGVDGPPGAATAKLSEDLFSIHHRDANEIKMQIFEKVGEKFGIKMGDYEDPKAYSQDVRSAFNKLKLSDGGLQAIRDIERDLGLQELGISLEELINAIGDVDGEANEKLTEAIEKSISGDNNGLPAAAAAESSPFLADEIGLYLPVNSWGA